MTPSRFGNLIVALILGVLVGAAFNLLGGCTVDDDFVYQSPSERCQGLSTLTCGASVTTSDGGSD